MVSVEVHTLFLSSTGSHNEFTSGSFGLLAFISGRKLKT